MSALGLCQYFSLSRSDLILTKSRPLIFQCSSSFAWDNVFPKGLIGQIKKHRIKLHAVFFSWNLFVKMYVIGSSKPQKLFFWKFSYIFKSNEISKCSIFDGLLLLSYTYIYMYTYKINVSHFFANKIDEIFYTLIYV